MEQSCLNLPSVLSDSLLSRLSYGHGFSCTVPNLGIVPILSPPEDKYILKASFYICITFLLVGCCGNTLYFLPFDNSFSDPLGCAHFFVHTTLFQEHGTLFVRVNRNLVPCVYLYVCVCALQVSSQHKLSYWFNPSASLPHH